MNRTKRQVISLLLLALIFIMPSISAYFFYLHPQWLSSKLTNRGKLLNPPQSIWHLSDNTKWRLILWYPAACDLLCREQLDKLGRVRLALGRRLYNLEIWLITNNETVPVKLKQWLIEQDIYRLVAAENNIDQHLINLALPQIFIVNPHDYLVLAYSLKNDSKDIYHDLKQLLTANSE